MIPSALRFALPSALLLAACTTPAPLATPGVVDVPGDASSQPSSQLSFKLASGTYRCEYGANVNVERDARDPNLLLVGWNGARYPMRRNLSSSGLPRFEDANSGLVWIDLPWKSVLLDGKAGKPLVSECRGATPAQGGS